MSGVPVYCINVLVVFMWFVFVKDTVIFERLKTDQPFQDVTLAHLEEFANIGWHHIVLVVLFKVTVYVESA